MDKLAEKLKQDAARIDVAVSEELDDRIEASLRGLAQERPLPRQEPRPALFWWASSLTGIAAAIVVIAIINARSEPDAAIETVAGNNSPATVPDSRSTLSDVPRIDWKAESAMLTEPLRQELEDLQSDLRKAEEKVKQDIGL